MYRSGLIVILVLVAIVVQEANSQCKSAMVGLLFNLNHPSLYSHVMTFIFTSLLSILPFASACSGYYCNSCGTNCWDCSYAGLSSPLCSGMYYATYLFVMLAYGPNSLNLHQPSYLYGNNIYSIPNAAFAGSPYVSVLSLPFNYIQYIQAGAFSGMLGLSAL